MFTNKNVPSFHVDSEFREENSLSATNLNFKLQTEINSNFTHLALISTYVPKNWYVVNPGFNKFTLKEGLNEVIVTIPIGNYSKMTFKTALDNALNLAGNYTYATSYSELTNKYTWIVSGNLGVQPVYEFIGNDHMQDIMGFKLSHSFNNDSLTSTRQVNLNHTKYLQIRSDIVDNSGNLSSYDTDILARIPCNHVDYGSVIEYRLQTFNSGLTKIKHNKSNTYNFRLLDEHNREMNLHGNDWSFTLLMMKHDLPITSPTEIKSVDLVPIDPGSKIKEPNERQFVANYKR